MLEKLMDFNGRRVGGRVWRRGGDDNGKLMRKDIRLRVIVFKCKNIQM